MKRLIKYFLFFSYPGKVCGTILKGIIAMQRFLCENLYRRN